MNLLGGRRRKKVLLRLGAAVAVVAAGLGLTASAAGVPEGVIAAEGSPDAIPDHYLVVLKDAAASSVADQAAHLTEHYTGTITDTYTSAVQGFAVSMSAQQAKLLAADPVVARVEQDQKVQLDATQSPVPSWGLDRIDQRTLPLDNSYTYTTTASNVHAYIIDTGILTSHTDFGGRATVGTDTVGDGRNGIDCNGHGTHVAGTVGGSAYGVAKEVSLVAVRVLNCNGSGSYAGVIAGVDWVTKNAIKPAVANMSLGGGASSTLDNALFNSIKSGVTYAVAAGNSNLDACAFSPARVPWAITVGATDINDSRAWFSNYGSCVSLFAPGVGITSDWNTSNTATNKISGTSMASPHTAGTAALYLSAYPSATPAQVKSVLVNNATPGVVIDPGPDSPNRLLYTGGASTLPPPPPPPSTRITNGGFETGDLSGWDLSGTGSVTTSNPHFGRYAAVLGSTIATNGDSSISQSFIVPTGNTTLTFWYNVFCDDQIQYDWATATLTDDTAGTRTTALPPTCTQNAGWTKASVNVLAGHTYTLTLTNHDDNYAVDPTYTVFDDVTLS